jgi:broad specificity phosphatase PhoE
MWCHNLFFRSVASRMAPLEGDAEGELTGMAQRKALLSRVADYLLPQEQSSTSSAQVSMQAFRSVMDEGKAATSQSEAYEAWIGSNLSGGQEQLPVEEWMAGIFKIEADTSDAEFATLATRWVTILSTRRRTVVLHRVFGLMDADASGEVDLKEFVNMAEGEKNEDALLPHLFHNLDQQGNSDGMLSLDEWVRGLLELSEPLSDDAFVKESEKWLQNLGRNQRHIWRRAFARGHAKAFVTAMRATGATHALFVHHGNAGKLRPDSLLAADPELSPIGSAQCTVAKATWYGRLPVRNVLLTSSSTRSRQTAQQVSGLVSTTGEEPVEAHVIEVEHLRPHEAPLCEQLFKERGFAPLRPYLDSEGGETAFGVYAERACHELTTKFRGHGKTRPRRPKSARFLMDEAARSMKRLAEVGARSLTSRVSRAPPRIRPQLLSSPRGGTYIPVFGHAVFVNAVAHAVASASGASESAVEPILDMDLGEAEAIMVPLYGAACQHLKRPS